MKIMVVGMDRDNGDWMKGPMLQLAMVLVLTWLFRTKIAAARSRV